MPEPEMPSEISACKDLLLKLKKSPHAGPFLYPVDPHRLNIPDYYDKIKHPMDLSTLSKKIETGAYKTPEEFKADVNLMLSNCYTYNQPDTAVYKMGLSLEKLYKQLLAKGALEGKTQPENSPKLPEGEKKKQKMGPSASGMAMEEREKCLDALGEISKSKHRRINWPFLEPVDESLVPNYYALIKHPMDISTMKKKLVSGKYQGTDEFVRDFDIMISNCHTFNTEGTEVYVCATKLDALFKQIFMDKKKKKAGDDAARISALKSLIAQYEGELRRLERRPAPPEFGYEEKVKLKKRVEALPHNRMKSVVAFIQQNVPYTLVDQDEIEVNLDELDQSALARLSDVIQETCVQEQHLDSDSSSE
ncbi:uncharacterized protein NEMAJ01_0646 [Nematocida major]|uniref:uncharacterized protein n=1 Tax=Nematocida major TaxID=1912982 RepID=UPI002007C377|nr:uncharacterized protein NEMAJ01_0646 [Nematocida major]KAH9385750.1 hypothetical protein NEMAJ01_0646 [Nematocida major]